MRLINNKQPVVVGEIIDQRRRRLVLSATAQVPRVVLGARAPAFRPQHGHVIRNAAPQAFRLAPPARGQVPLQLLHELDLDVVAGPLDLLGRRGVVRRRVEHVRVDGRGRVILADEGERLDRPGIVTY